MSRSTLFRVEADLDTEGVYRRSLDSRQALDQKMTELVNLREKKRQADQALSDKEVDLAMEYRAANAELSQTQFDKQVRWYVHKNPEWLALRDEANRLTGLVEAADADRSVLKRDIEIACGRMISLGGELFFRGAETLYGTD